MREHSKEYENYMKSDEWKAKREERLQLDDQRCVCCGRPNGLQKDGVTPILQVHHIHYKNLGHESMEDIVSVCSGCHRKLHRYYKRFRSWEDKQRAVGG